MEKFESLRGLRSRNEPEVIDPNAPDFLASPNDIKDYVRMLHANDAPINSKALDTILLGNTSTDADLNLWTPTDEPIVDETGRGIDTLNRRHEMKKRYGDEQAWDGRNEIIWTPYNTARSLIRAVKMRESETFYDLGAGYGRMVLYAGITAVAACKGIEMVGERLEMAQAAIERLELDKTSLIAGKVQDHDYSDGDIFYMYSPFSAETFEHVFDQLERIGAEKPITIVNRGGNIMGAKLRGRFGDYQLVERGINNLGGVYVFEHGDVIGTEHSRINKDPSNILFRRPS